MLSFDKSNLGKILSTPAFECGQDRRDLTKYPNVGNLISPHPSVITATKPTRPHGMCPAIKMVRAPPH